MSSTRERLIAAAFDLFAEHGFDSSTVDDVAERAGVSRTTFFRHFKSKEDAIFPDHPAVIQQIEARLASATESTGLLAVTEGARLVLVHHVGEGRQARARYHLTRTVASLRAREVAGQQQYQQTFRSFLNEWMPASPLRSLRAELMANAVVTAHNHVLRRWLREETDDATALREFDEAMNEVIRAFGHSGTSNESPDSAVVILRSDASTDAIITALQGLTTHP